MKWLFALSLCSINVGLAQDVLVYGGADEDVFLGCLTCSEYDSDSIFNQFGPHGNEFASESIRNRFSVYGSRFSHLSACSSSASDPPILVDEDGGYYGRLTLNPYHPEISETTEIIDLLESSICVE